METYNYRPMAEWEYRLIQRLLEADFPGRNALREQLNDVQVRSIDDNGSLGIVCNVGTRAAVEKRVPVEGEAIDCDGTSIHYLLHVVEGQMNELEVFKEDSSSVMQHPDPGDVCIVILGA